VGLFGSLREVRPAPEGGKGEFRERFQSTKEILRKGRMPLRLPAAPFFPFNLYQGEE
jgi:hypothetical protein